MKFYSKPISEHVEVPLPDEGRWEEIVENWARWQAPAALRHDGRNSCYVVSVGDWPDLAVRSAQLAEILALVRAQGDRVVGHETFRLAKANPRTLFGTGAAQKIADRAMDCAADLLVVDAELSPSQMRNLEDTTGLAVCDREAAILNVFLRHARSRKARLQVEIAHLEYLRPRISGLGLDMDQQAGGVMRGRGPGETASELMARHLDRRLTELRKALKKLQRSSQTQRKARSSCKRIALVGYTNAGKTTLMNALTSADLSARDMPFETLDTTSRCLTRHGGDVILSDTVGFIRRLPERLLDSFESTLAEIKEASLLVLVIDAADPEWVSHIETTEDMIVRLGADGLGRFYVFNKLDRLTTVPHQDRLRELSHGNELMLLSAGDANAVEQLEAALIRAVRADQCVAQVLVPYRARDVLNAVYAKCRVIDTEAHKTGLLFTIEGQPHVVAQIARASEERLS